jgi:hypothetical protein
MMSCISPPALDDGQILAFLDGETSEAVASHLEACPNCRERSEALRTLQNALQSRLFRLSCPEPETLGEFQLGLLPIGQASKIAAHLQECPHCAQEMEQLRDFLRIPETAFLADRWGPLKILMARLVGSTGESGNQLLETRLRGSEQGPITLEADGILIVLDLKPAARSGWRMLGQIAVDDLDRWTGARVELHQAGELRMHTTIDPLGAFFFDVIPEETAELYLLPEGGPVVIANLEFLS